jgi:PncC family amidohydrolase
MIDKSPEHVICKILSDRGLSLAVAESCTGGLVSHRLTNVPGSSSYFLGGIVAYSNEVKMRVLGVNKETLEKTGAVSKETVIEMAEGVRRILGADIGLSTSGIAGPGGGSDEKPVGLTWIGISVDNFDRAWKYKWPGNRLSVKEQTADKALALLVESLSGMLVDD